MTTPTRFVPHALPGEPSSACYLGLDLGGTNFRLGLRRAGEDRLLACESIPADAGWTAEDLDLQMRTLLGRARGGESEGPGSRIPAGPCPAGMRDPGLSSPRAIGFALTGDIDCRDGICY